jgi:protein-disulfide isomerase
LVKNMSEHKSSLFNKFSPKTNYFLGLGSGIIALIIVGFFVMLGLFLSDGQDKDSKVTSNKAGAPTAPSAPPNGGQDAGSAGADTDFEIIADDHIRGDFDAPITIVEFSDFQCPFCSRFHPTVQRIVDEYPGQVRWVYKHFPLASIHPQAQSAAEASECAYDQGGNDAFWVYGDALFANQSALGRDEYVRIATNQGLDVNDFESCIDSGKFRQKVQDDYQRGIAAGVRGTPGNFINGLSIPGAVPYEQIKAAVDSLL